MTESVLASSSRTTSTLPGPKPGPDERRELLDQFLRRAGCSLKALTSAADRSFGVPHLIVATGSVTAGLGTPHSDIDLLTIVPSDNVTLLPLMGYELPVRMDVRHLSERRLLDTEAIVRAGWPPTEVGAVSRDVLTRRESILDVLVRLALGVELETEQSADGRRWQAWRSTLEEPWLVEQMLSWRWWEAWRLRVTSRHLSPIVAAQRLSDATAAVIDAVAAEDGLVYTNLKWLPGKLTRMDAPYLMEALSVSQRFLGASDLEGHVRSCDRWVADQLDELASRHSFLGGPARLVFALAPGVEVIDAYQRQYVTRWRLRAVELRPALVSAAVQAGEEPLWVGDGDEDPPDWVVALLQQGMLSALVARNG